MPKKRIEHKGKSKHATQESEDLAFRRNDNENTEEEYTTVVDYEANKKYSKRLINNNWAKYEINPSDFETGDEEYEIPKTEDFNFLLKTASSDCSHFQFNSEKLWKNEESSVPLSNIFNLDLNILSSGLACVPFYEMMGLSESDLTVEDKQRFDAAADKSWKDYMLLREKSSKKGEDESKVKNCENVSRTLVEEFSDKLGIGVNSDKSEKTFEDSEVAELEKMDKNSKKVEVLENKSNDKKGGNKPKFFSENEEDLEDWLDSVLDD